MLRLNRFLVSKHFNKLSNVLLKNTYYYSSEPPDKTSTVRITEVKADTHSEPFLRTTNPELNLLGPHDLRAPLNGNIGIGFDDSKTLEFKLLVQSLTNITTFEKLESIQARDTDIDILLSDCHQSRRQKFFRILKYQKLFPQEMVSLTESVDGLDCSAHQLSSQAIKRFTPLFPKSKRHELSNGLTVVTISEKTVNDMSTYSEAVEEERDHFFEKFISNATNFCDELQKNGFWADFIDPYSGQPFLSERTNETLFETDDRFLHLGFKVEDLGCCKAIYHKQWTTHVIVGTIFTTAPIDSPHLKKLMTQSVNSKKDVSV